MVDIKTVQERNFAIMDYFLTGGDPEQKKVERLKLGTLDSKIRAMRKNSMAMMGSVDEADCDCNCDTFCENCNCINPYEIQTSQ